MMKKMLLLLVAICFVGSMSSQQDINLVVNTKKLGAPIQPTMYGLFFEDINFGADGGLYAELIKNRSFEFPQSLMGGKTFGKVEYELMGRPLNEILTMCD